MDTLKQQAERSPIDTIAGHLDSKIDALRLEMLTAISSLKELKSHDLGKLVEHQDATRAELLAQIVNLKELKSHDLIKLAEHQQLISVENNRRFDNLEKHIEACVPREEYARGYTAQGETMQTAFNESARAVDAAFNAQEKATAAALAAAERAVGKSEIASEKRFDAVNEFRAQLSDQAVTFLPRAEFDRVTASLTDKIEASNKSFIDRLDDLRSYRDTTSGKSVGLNAGWAILVALVSTVGVVITLVLSLRK
jgi:hypothetical protein